MKLVPTSEVQWQEQRSPKGRFHLFRRHLSEALGAPRDAGVAKGGHPFDVEMTRLPPGAANFPFHAHAAQWEFYIILSGTGEMRVVETIVPVKPGDAMMCPPGEAHQLKNTGDSDLVYYVIADNPPADVGFYPDSQKWTIKPQRKYFKMQEVEYYEGEE
jgi:uncharacterized cupin superfamily protein